MPRAFVTRRIPSQPIEKLARVCDVDVWEGEMPPPRDVLMTRVQGCSVILSLLSDTIDDEVMQAAGPDLCGIANYAVGFNNIDVKSAKRRGISVGNTPDVLTDATADVALGLLICAGRRFQESITQVKKLEWKTWEPLGLLGQEFREKTLGIVGMGRIGEAFAMRCVGAWNMRVLYASRSRKFTAENRIHQRAWNAAEDDVSTQRIMHVGLDEVFASSDFLSLHADLNPSTKHLVNADRLANMKPTSVLINTSRGGLVQQEDLYDALCEGRIFAAGLDVTDPEPLPVDSPLRSLDNCTILPHIGSATVQARTEMANRAVDNLVAALKGQPMPFPVHG